MTRRSAPRADARVGRLPAVAGLALTLRGWAVLLVGTAAVIAAPVLALRELLFVGLVLLGLVLAAVLPLALGAPRLRVQRVFEPRVVSAGDVVAVSVAVENRGAAIGSPLAAEDRLVRLDGEDVVSVDRERGEFVVPWLGRVGGASSRVRTRYRVHADTRGVHRLGPLLVTRGDALGLALRRTAVGSAQTLVVTPRAEQLDSDVLDAYGAGGSSPVAHATAGAGTDDVIPRDYRPGDAMRRVHWRASARTGELMVRQDEQNTDPHAWILLESRAERYPGAVGAERLEWAVSMAASIAVYLIDRGFETHLVETADVEDDMLSTDELEAAHDVLVHLARLRPGRADRGYDAAATIALSMRETGGIRPVFAVLTALRESDLDALGTLAAQSRPAFAFLVDGTEEEAAAVASLGWYPVPASSSTPIGVAWSDALSMRSTA